MIALSMLAVYMLLVLAAGRIRKVRTGKSSKRTALLLLLLVPIFATGFLSPPVWGLLFLGALGYAIAALILEISKRDRQLQTARKAQL